MFYGIKFKMTLYYGLFIMEIVDILCIVSVGYKYFISIFLSFKNVVYDWWYNTHMSEDKNHYSLSVKKSTRFYMLKGDKKYL